MFATAALVAATAWAQTETVIYSFPASSNPRAPLLLSRSTLYGMTGEGGIGYGTVFRLSQKNGDWREEILHTFSGNDDGAYAYSGLVDEGGVFYSTTVEGGRKGQGVFFSLTPVNGKWSESVLYSFTGRWDGSNPSSVPLWDSTSGVFYGVTPDNLTYPHCGSVFSISPDGTEHTIYLFRNGNDGCFPNTDLRRLDIGKKQTLVGATSDGGANGYGTVFTLSAGDRNWRESVIYTFAHGSDGAWPGDLVVDKSGDIFGIARGGAYDHGVAFELRKSGKRWSETTIYNFAGGADGDDPVGLTQDGATGALYGTTTYGGEHGTGTVFEIRRSGNSWMETVIHSFGASGDGQYPYVRPIRDAQTGVLYGVTSEGGQNNGGTIYAVSSSGSGKSRR